MARRLFSPSRQSSNVLASGLQNSPPTPDAELRSMRENSGHDVVYDNKLLGSLSPSNGLLSKALFRLNPYFFCLALRAVWRQGTIVQPGYMDVGRRRRAHLFSAVAQWPIAHPEDADGRLRQGPGGREGPREPTEANKPGKTPAGMESLGKLAIIPDWMSANDSNFQSLLNGGPSGKSLEDAYVTPADVLKYIASHKSRGARATKNGGKAWSFAEYSESLEACTSLDTRRPDIPREVGAENDLGNRLVLYNVTYEPRGGVAVRRRAQCQEGLSPDRKGRREFPHEVLGA
ncbi:hypothetical protein LX36DRAFT_673621 [Colletotrichum falcatum]|nr:hypothetical protein LX36DRAFT_673621 [Colletotrichum falcatum]